MTEERRQNQRGRRASDKTTAADTRGRRASDRKGDGKFVVLTWGLTVVVTVLLVALIGLSYVVRTLREQQQDTEEAVAATRANTRSLNAGTCVIVATLENGASSVRASLRNPVAPLPAERRSQLQQSLAFQVGLADSLRARVTCPDPPPSTKIPTNPQPKTRTTP